MEKECRIVQDLLPNYLENVTNDETNNFVKNHIKTCEKCKNTYEVMKENIKMNSDDNLKTVNYMKKFNKHLKLLRLIVLIVVITFIIIIARKVVILQILNVKSDTTLNKFGSNYYIKKTVYRDGITTIAESYNMNDDYLNIMKSKNFNGRSYEIINYKKNGETINLFSDGKNKIISDKIIGEKISPSIGTSSFFANIGIAFSVKIDKVCINNRKCYLIHYDNCDKYIDIETGFTVREVDSNGTFTDYFYEFSKVSEENILRPDSTEYAVE